MATRASRAATVALLWLASGCVADQEPGPLAGKAAPIGASGVEAVYERIAAARAVASRIRIDGVAGDWEGLFAMHDGSSVLVEPGTLDITRIAIAPMESEVLVMIETREPPTPRGHCYTVTLDVCGTDAPDFWVDLFDGKRGHSMGAWPRSEDLADDIETIGVDCVVGRVVECRIPHAELVRALAKVGAGPELALRPWMRANVYSWNDQAGKHEIADNGPEVASFRLLEERYPLDSPSPAELIGGKGTATPFHGMWYVGQGPMTDSTHRGTWAYDFIVRAYSLESSTDVGGGTATEQRTWGSPVVAPSKCVVVGVESAHQDHTGNSTKLEQPGKANLVSVRLESGAILTSAHLMQNSVPVTLGQHCERGQVLGRVGNSGYSSGPHLHLHIQASDAKSSRCPLAFLNVRVGLNATDEDPWVRVLDEWLVREGYFVGSAQSTTFRGTAETEPFGDSRGRSTGVK